MEMIGITMQCIAHSLGELHIFLYGTKKKVILNINNYFKFHYNVEVDLKPCCTLQKHEMLYILSWNHTMQFFVTTGAREGKMSPLGFAANGCRRRRGNPYHELSPPDCRRWETRHP